MKYTLTIVFLMLSGCTQYMWKHTSHSDMAQFKRDAYECERDMRQSGYYGTGFARQINATNFAERCMGARGYSKTAVEQ